MRFVHFISQLDRKNSKTLSSIYWKWKVLNFLKEFPFIKLDVIFASKKFSKIKRLLKNRRKPFFSYWQWSLSNMFWKINFMKKLKKLIYKKRTVLEEFLSVIENQCIVWEPIQPWYLFSLLWIKMKMKKTHFYCSEKRLTTMISILELSLWISNFCLFFFFFL